VKRQKRGDECHRVFGCVVMKSSQMRKTRYCMGGFQLYLPCPAGVRAKQKPSHSFRVSVSENIKERDGNIIPAKPAVTVCAYRPFTV
jgi:hypothetical protein